MVTELENETQTESAIELLPETQNESVTELVTAIQNESVTGLVTAAQNESLTELEPETQNESVSELVTTTQNKSITTCVKAEKCTLMYMKIRELAQLTSSITLIDNSCKYCGKVMSSAPSKTLRIYRHNVHCNKLNIATHPRRMLDESTVVTSGQYINQQAWSDNHQQQSAQGWCFSARLASRTS